MVLAECLTKYGEERKPGTVSQNLEPSVIRWGEKYLYLFEGQFIGPPVIMAKLMQTTCEPSTASPPAQGRHP